MKTTTENPAQTPEELLNDLHALVTEAEKMIGSSSSEHTSDAISALRTRFDAAYDRLAAVYSTVQKKVIAGAKCTDNAIRTNPYQALAVAAGAGLLAGVLLGRRSK